MSPHIPYPVSHLFRISFPFRYTETSLRSQRRVVSLFICYLLVFSSTLQIIRACLISSRRESVSPIEMCCDISVTNGPKCICDSLCQATCTGKVNYRHGHVVVTFQNLHENFRKSGVHSAPWPIKPAFCSQYFHFNRISSYFCITCPRYMLKDPGGYRSGLTQRKIFRKWNSTTRYKFNTSGTHSITECR